MGFLENRRRRAHAQSANWELMTALMLAGVELVRAEEAGITESEQLDRASQVRDAVLDEIGGSDRFTETFIDADFELRSSNRNAELEDSLERAMEATGYKAARSRLFPESGPIM